jgi:HPt (histidine-containing phosphotransfer) domain-containing protein
MHDIIDKKTFSKIKSIMGDRLPTMVNFYLEDGYTYIENIEEGIKNNDLEKINRPAHTLKSSSKQLGLQQVHEISKKIERESTFLLKKEGGSLDEIKTLAKELREDFKKAESELKKSI